MEIASILHLFSFSSFLQIDISINPPIVVWLEDIFGLFYDWIQVVVVGHFCAENTITFQLRLEEHREELNFVIGQFRVPEVNNQINSRACTVVPRLVVKWIVEDDALILHQGLCLVANTHASTFSR